MEPSVLASASMTSATSHSSFNRRFTLPDSRSSHILAYLCQDSAQSISSYTSDAKEPRAFYEHCASPPKAIKRVSCSGAWWSNTGNSNRLPPCSSSNFKSSLEKALLPTTSTFIPKHTRHRPPPLQLSPLEPAFGSTLQLSDGDKTPLAVSSSKLHKPDTISPWLLLDAFPSPPVEVPRSRTSVSISRMLRRGENGPQDLMCPNRRSKSTIRDHDEEKDANNRSTPIHIRANKSHASFGSLGKGLWKVASAPDSPVPPISSPTSPAVPLPPACRNRSNSASAREVYGPKGFATLQRRGTLVQKIFNLTGPERKISSRPIVRYAPHHENRIASCPVKYSYAVETPPDSPRYRSISQPSPTKSEYKKLVHAKGEESGGYLLSADIGKDLAIPPRRKRSPSYINLYVPPRRQINTSPTRISFNTLGALASAPATPIDPAFDLPNELMYLPSSESAQTVRVELDPFGAGELSSFFRFEHRGNNIRNVESDADMVRFYEKVRIEGRGLEKQRSRRSARRTSQGMVPEIVVSSSAGLFGQQRKESRTSPGRM